MQSNWVNRLGNWNPQLLRESRGRLKTRTLITTIALVAIAQILLLLGVFQLSTLPTDEKWSTIWATITGLMPFLLFALGSYYLVNDLSDEQRQGTLNFIRLSPRPAWQILLGKLLGVPLLCYLVLVLVVPLHLVATIGSKTPPALLLSYYLMLIASCGACYSTAMLFAMGGNSQGGTSQRYNTAALSFAAIALLFFAPLFSGWNAAVTWWPIYAATNFKETGEVVTWLTIPLNQSVWLSHGFTLVVLGSSTYLIWQVLLRRFRQPRATVISKRQSYAILFYVLVLVLGFVVPGMDDSIDMRAISAFFMAGIAVLLVLLLMLAICPQRQALRDWVRYPPQGWQGWIWADKSPALVAIALLLVIANALVFPVLLITAQVPLPNLLLSVIIVTNILFIYGLFIQQVYASQVRNPLTWAIGGLLVWWIVPSAFLGVLGLIPEKVGFSTLVWNFLGYPFFDSDQIIFPIVAILAQWLLLAFLLRQFQQTLHHLRQTHSPVSTDD